ncbi:MAG: NAD(P)-binding domain-containing protein [Pseudomonadota bacterium]
MATTNMAVIGAGNMGSGLARALAAAGVEVVLGMRDAGKAAALAQGSGSVPVLDVAGAVAEADMVVLALPYGASVQVLEGLPAAALQGKVLVDISNPVTADFLGLQLGTTTSAAEAIQAAAPGAHVVKAFNTIFAQLLGAEARQGKAPVQVFVAGDDADAKARVQALSSVLGFEPVDAGSLRNARFLEPLGGMNIQFGFFLGWGPAAAPAWVRL